MPDTRPTDASIQYAVNAVLDAVCTELTFLGLSTIKRMHITSFIDLRAQRGCLSMITKSRKELSAGADCKRALSLNPRRGGGGGRGGGAKMNKEST